MRQIESHLMPWSVSLVSNEYATALRSEADWQAATIALVLMAGSVFELMSRTVHGALHQGIMTSVPSPSSAPLI